MGMSNRAKWAVGGTAGAVLIVGALFLPFGHGGGQASPRPAADLGAAGTTSVVETTTSAAPATTTTTAVTTTTTAKTTTTTRKAPAKAPMPAPTPHPVTVAVPPPPHPAPVPGCAPTMIGTNAAKADVKAALLAAGGRQYWANAANPPLVSLDDPNNPDATGPRAVITVPPALIEAIAWQESGWQSAIKACDGGVGTMQIMDATATWMNQRFGTSNDYTTLAGNVAIGAQYLEWLIAYFGENNFGHHYDITDPDLLTAVIVGYNAGAGAVQFSGGHTVASHYATTVQALMSSQPWG
jgi:hypothetical protein